VISFVVPAHNEEELIGASLRAIHAAARALAERYELIVADDASTDRTAAIASQNDARVVSVERRQIAAARNAGARAAVGERLIFVDADTLVDESVLRAALSALDAGAVGGGSAVRFDGRIPRWAELLLPAFVWTFRVAGIAAGCFLFCNRRAFDAIGGFDETLYAAEEVFLSRALKREGRFVVLREAVTTSGRKLRVYSAWEILRMMGRIAVRGPNAVRSREELGLWYDDRRRDPGG
jgi:glycosyltransferase involved in cell wall biosynthesis